jgi:hypothetical protein
MTNKKSDYGYVPNKKGYQPGNSGGVSGGHQPEKGQQSQPSNPPKKK